MTKGALHLPVMLSEVLESIQPANDEIIVDGTFGAGGYTKALLDSCHCNVWSFDRDPSVLPTVESIKQAYPNRFHFVESCFGDMAAKLKENNINKVDAIVLDIGVSSMQIDQADRGFSFQKDGPLDMRMGTQDKTAADLVNTLDEKDLADIIYHYGEERQSRAIAKAIVEKRKERPFETTFDLVETIHNVVFRKGKIDPATKTFQALRIAVNDELGELKKVLEAAERLLKSGGRLVIVSFHSLEDSLVKEFLKNRSAPKKAINKYKEQEAEDTHYSFSLPFKKPLTATKEEINLNPRSRSAKLRLAIRTDAPLQTERENAA